MKKLVLILVLLGVRVDAADPCSCCFRSLPCWTRYYDYQTDDGMMYGYDDMYTYPYGYYQPINRFFSPCPPRSYYCCPPYTDGHVEYGPNYSIHYRR